ncbi:nitroreductase family protein [Bacillus sp. J33]|uniref:nitroreductase family protein n=1 Tax=Bacillus sp. J33 TaxID=935836 RepID=UPI00047DD4E0|nr:nitroreductase [Bacillus sp. J33]
MSIFNILESRRAIRNYQSAAIEREKIERLLHAATLAPNDRMREPWSFYVIQGDKKAEYEEIALHYLKERFPSKPHLIESSLRVVKNTPVIIAVAADLVHGDEEASADNEYATCCAIHSMWLAAEELGLGFVWRTRGVGLVRDNRLRQFLSLPDDKKVIGSVFIGYPEENDAGKQKEKSRTSYREKTQWLS